jgi:hypothetical protein
MPSSDSGGTLDLSLRPSPRALRWLTGLHAAALLLALAAQPPRWVGLCLAALFIASRVSLRRHPAFGYGPQALVRLVRHADGSWAVENAAGVLADATLLGNSVVQGWLIVLNFRRKDGRRRSRVLLGDEADDDAFRRLRARLIGP